ncbi:hypothetical protein WMY93_033291 [Mugilogobius chulae]|uniref:Uncharacterized protein n=1 Tax=Mugilogobius chulae TaxID=88201 RepID=A0AAW0MHE1_9GOBI
MLLSPPPSPLPRPSLRPSPELLRESERSVFAFYCLVRSGAPVWRLEEVRVLEVRVWDGCHGDLVPLSPGQALVYALVHDRTDYTRALLRSFGRAALTPQSCDFCTRSVGALHLRLAVRYDRQGALELILDTLKSSLSPADRRLFLDSRSLCAHSDGDEAAVGVAVAMGRSRCLFMLLASGATATGLEEGLRQLEAGGGGPEALRTAPPTLLLHALRSIARTAPETINHLPRDSAHLPRDSAHNDPGLRPPAPGTPPTLTGTPPTLTRDSAHNDQRLRPQ